MENLENKWTFKYRDELFTVNADNEEDARSLVGEIIYAKFNMIFFCKRNVMLIHKPQNIEK